jgi:hypothetical protein
MISDKVWSAMDQQVRDEAKRKSAAKATIRPKRGSMARRLPPASIPRSPLNSLSKQTDTSSQTNQSSHQLVRGSEQNFSGNLVLPGASFAANTNTVPQDHSNTVSNASANSNAGVANSDHQGQLHKANRRQ